MAAGGYRKPRQPELAVLTQELPARDYPDPFARP
jgi:hypothetical protein